MYCEVSDSGDDECGDMIKKEDMKFISKKPRWKVTDTSWPILNDELMHFYAQIYLKENDVTRKHLTFESTVFLFIDLDKSKRLVYSIFCQNTNLQTAEEHYRIEAIMWDYEENYKNISVVTQCIDEGDRFVHEFILEHTGVTNEALEVLMKKGKNKNIRKLAEKKFKIRKDS